MCSSRTKQRPGATRGRGAKPARDQSSQTESSERRSVRYSRVAAKVTGAKNRRGQHSATTKVVSIRGDNVGAHISQVVPPWQASLVFPTNRRPNATVDAADLSRLDLGEKLNDNLINFALLWLHMKHRPKREITTEFVQTYFGSTLVRKEIDLKTADKLFSSDYLVVPINKDHHWFLVSLCHFSKLKSPSRNELQPQEKPKIVIVDSYYTYDPHSSSNFHSSTVSDLLTFTETHLERTLREGEVLIIYAKNILRQGNVHDCGIFVLAYAARLFKDPAGFVARLGENDFDESYWDCVRPEELRSHLKRIIQREYAKRCGT